MPRLTVPPIGGERPTTPIASEIDVAFQRVNNPAVPLPQRPTPSLNGDPKGRNWSGWAARQLLGGGSPLYIGIPTLEQKDDGTWFVAHEYLKTGSTSEAAMLKYPGIPEFGGERTNGMFAGNMTYIGIADTAGNTTWFGINVGGWMGHVSAMRSVTICGPAVPPDAVIKPDGKSKVMFGTFDRPFLNPNDLCIDESIVPGPPGSGGAFMQTVAFVADTGTVASKSGRIAKTVHVSEGTPAVRHVETTTWATLPPGSLPYGLVRWPDGTILYVDRASNKIMVAKPNGQPPVEFASGFDGPFRLDAFSDGSLLVSDWNGTRKLTEVSPTGTKRDQGVVWSKQGYPTEFFYETYIDKHGAQGPVDDIITLGYGTSRSIQRRGRTDGYGNLGDVNATDGSWLKTGSYTIRQGMVGHIQEIDWHYGWGLGGAPAEAKLAFTGDAGSAGFTELYWPEPALATELGKFNPTLYNRGRTVWDKGTTPETGVLRPSGRLTMGIYGQNWVHGYTFEQLVAEGKAKFAEWVRGGTATFPGGMGTTIPRPEVTDADCRALCYYAFCHTSHAMVSMSPAVIDSGPPIPPQPPADVTGPTLTVTSWPTEAASFTITVSAQDPSGVAFVALYVDGTEVERDTASPYVFSYEFPPEAEPGAHTFVVVGDDTKGNRTMLPPVTVLKPFPPTIDTFSVTPSRITGSQTAVVAWTTSHAKTVTLNAEPVLPDGHLEVSPDSTTEYELVADGLRRRVTLEVGADVEVRINDPNVTVTVITAPQP